MSKRVPESMLAGDMIRMPLPNNGYIMYPAKFAQDAIQKRKYSIFLSQGSDGSASVLLATTAIEAKTILMGEYDHLAQILLDIPWKEDRVKTSGGLLYRKIAPSLSDLEKFIIKLKEEHS